MNHDWVQTPGVLDPPNQRIYTWGADQGWTERRWLCSCGSTGNWTPISYLRPHTVEKRLRTRHAEHAKRMHAKEAS